MMRAAAVAPRKRPASRTHIPYRRMWPGGHRHHTKAGYLQTFRLMARVSRAPMMKHSTTGTSA